MYPQQDLIGFARQKAALRRSIALHRERCVDAAARAARPIEVVDNVRAFLKQLSPAVKMAAVPLGFVVTRAVFPRYRFLRKLVRWAPLAIAVVRAVSSGRKAHAAGQPAPAARAQASQFTEG